MLSRFRQRCFTFKAGTISIHVVLGCMFASSVGHFWGLKMALYTYSQKASLRSAEEAQKSENVAYSDYVFRLNP